MFKIDMESNSITPLRVRTFGELGFRERNNLQEWIAKNPSCLGEDLLIIQKEFSGFPIRMNDSIYSLSISRGRWSSSKTNWTTPAATSRGRP
jgi:hypothetical protein